MWVPAKVAFGSMSGGMAAVRHANSLNCQVQEPESIGHTEDRSLSTGLWSLSQEEKFTYLSKRQGCKESCTGRQHQLSQWETTAYGWPLPIYHHVSLCGGTV